MRVEPHDIGSIVHVIKRGARGMPIVRDESDRKRFVNLLWYANDEFRDQFWDERIAKLPPFTRPDEWPERKPLVHILAWALMPNHFHIVLKPVQENGMSTFMQKLCGSMTTHFNAKYEERGSLFQGAYKGRTADLHGDGYLRNLAAYVMVKNPFELYPGGLSKAMENFDNAFSWAEQYPYCSLGDFMKKTPSLILNSDTFVDSFNTPRQFKVYARQYLQERMDRKQIEEMELARSRHQNANYTTLQPPRNPTSQTCNYKSDL